MNIEIKTKPAMGRFVIGSSGGRSSGTPCLLIFLIQAGTKPGLQANNMFVARPNFPRPLQTPAMLRHQMLNHGVTHTYLMRSSSRSKIFTGKLSMRTKNNSIVAICNSVIR
jgi:hypothetical protein